MEGDRSAARRASALAASNSQVISESRRQNTVPRGTVTVAATVCSGGAAMAGPRHDGSGVVWVPCSYGGSVWCGPATAVWVLCGTMVWVPFSVWCGPATVVWVPCVTMVWEPCGVGTTPHPS